MRISAIVEALVTAGATPEMILCAVRAAEEQASDALEKRRASDRARQQRRRHATAREAAVTACDTPLPDKERSPAPPKEINPTPPKPIPADEPVDAASPEHSPGRRRATRLPERFEPDWDFAAGKGFGRTQAEAEFEKFRDYWTAKAGRDAAKLDWPATWRNWIRNAGGPRAFGGRAPPPRAKRGFREHQDEVQRELDRALGRSAHDEFAGAAFELEPGDWRSQREAEAGGGRAGGGMP